MLDKKKIVTFMICKIIRFIYLIERALSKLSDKLFDFYTTIDHPDPKAEKWAKHNTWFGEDKILTYSAFDIHKDLTEKEGFDPKSDKYYDEIDKRLYRRFKNRYLKYFSHNN